MQTFDISLQTAAGWEHFQGVRATELDTAVKRVLSGAHEAGLKSPRQVADGYRFKLPKYRKLTIVVERRV